MTRIEQHMKLSKQDRQKHIDLTTECYGYVIKRGRRKDQLSDDKKHAKKSLLNFHQIEDFTGRQIHTCHLCDNHSQAPDGFVCINPQHLYFGTVSENNHDKPQDVRKESAFKAGKIGGKAPASDKQKKSAAKIGAKNGSETQKILMKEGRHANQQHHTCPHCGVEGKGGIMKRWHFYNCKHKD